MADTEPITVDVDALSKQFAGWIVNNVTKMTEPKGADLFVAVVMHRGGERAGCTYREGRFAKDAAPASDDPEVSR